MPSQRSSSNSLSRQQPYWFKWGTIEEGKWGVRLLVSHWGHMGSYSSSPFIDMSVSFPFAQACWVQKSAMSSLVSDTLVTSQKLLAYCSNGSRRLLNAKTCRALFILARTSGTHPLQKDSIFSVNAEEKLAQTSSDLFQHCLWDFFFPFLLWERYANNQRHRQSYFVGALGSAEKPHVKTTVGEKKWFLFFFLCRGR